MEVWAGECTEEEDEHKCNHIQRYTTSRSQSTGTQRRTSGTSRECLLPTCENAQDNCVAKDCLNMLALHPDSQGEVDPIKGNF